MADTNSNKKKPSGLLWQLRRLTLAAFYGVAMAVILGYLGRFHWFLDLFANFRLQYLLILGVIFPLLLWQRLWKFALFSGIGIVALGISPLRYYLGEKTPAQNGELVLLSFNVHTSNNRKDDVVALIREQGADLVALYEVDQAWMRALSSLGPAYRVVVPMPREDNFGMALLAKGVSVEAVVVATDPEGPESIVAHLTDEHFRGRMIFTHPLPPMSGKATRSRDQQLVELSKMASRWRDEPVVLAGDLNATPWSSSIVPLQKAGLRDGRIGFGISPTWQRKRPWLAIPIDHIFINDNVQVSDVKILDATGSDHNPLLVRFSSNRAWHDDTSKP